MRVDLTEEGLSRREHEGPQTKQYIHPSLLLETMTFIVENVRSQSAGETGRFIDFKYGFRGGTRVGRDCAGHSVRRD